MLIANLVAMSKHVNQTILALLDGIESRVEDLSNDTNTHLRNMEARFAGQPKVPVVTSDSEGTSLQVSQIRT